MSALRSDDDGRLVRLVREGVVRPAHASVNKGVFTTKPPRPKGNASRRANVTRGAPGGPVKFWDASAISPLLLAETTTRAVQTLAAKDAAMLVWWATEVECASAIARLQREGALDEAACERRSNA